MSVELHWPEMVYSFLSLDLLVNKEREKEKNKKELHWYRSIFIEPEGGLEASYNSQHEEKSA